MALAKTFVFAIYGQSGEQKVRVVSDNLPNAISTLQSVAPDEDKPLRFHLVDVENNNFRLIKAD